MNKSLRDEVVGLRHKWAWHTELADQLTAILDRHPPADGVVVPESLLESLTKSADEPRAVLMDKSLRQYAHEKRIAACSAWSAVAKLPIELDEAKCELASANEAALRSAIDELADLSTPSQQNTGAAPRRDLLAGAIRVTLTEYSTGITTTIAEAAMTLPAGTYWIISDAQADAILSEGKA